MATVQDLIDQYNGHIFGITGPDQGQCTAVPHAWEEMLGLAIVYGNAKDTYDNASADVYVKTLNTPDNFPDPGAIIVWDGTWGGGYGHTAVVVSANVNTFDCLEQNDGDGGITHVGRHDYAHITGWFYPRLLLPAAPTPGPTPVSDPTPDPVVVPVVPVVPVAPDPTTIPDPVTTVTGDVSWEERDAEKVVNWLGTTFGGLFLKLLGAALGWLSVNAGLLHINAVAASLIGVVAGSTISNANNPSVPNSTKKQ